MGGKPRTTTRSRAAEFADFDLSEFWRDVDYARKSYVCSPPTVAMIESVEQELGVRLPRSYIELMRTQNGGIPKDECFRTDTATSWAEDHVAITGIFGIGRDKRYSLCGEAGSKFWIEHWGYPDIGICICDCPSAGHDMIMLDYRECGPGGEPTVVHVDQEADYKITFLAPDFASFIRGLVHESEFDTSEQDLADDRDKIANGSFSTRLTELLDKFDGPDLGPAIRNICDQLTTDKGYFALHNDKLSVLIYDILFLLYTASNRVPDKDAYLLAYPEMVALGDGKFTTGGYAPDFIEDWMKSRQNRSEIVSTSGSLQFSEPFRESILRKAAAW